MVYFKKLMDHFNHTYTVYFDDQGETTAKVTDFPTYQDASNWVNDNLYTNSLFRTFKGGTASIVEERTGKTIKIISI